MVINPGVLKGGGGGGANGGGGGANGGRLFPIGRGFDSAASTVAGS